MLFLASVAKFCGRRENYDSCCYQAHAAGEDAWTLPIPRDNRSRELNICAATHGVPLAHAQDSPKSQHATTKGTLGNYLMWSLLTIEMDPADTHGP